MSIISLRRPPAKSLRLAVLRCLQGQEATAEELAEHLGRPLGHVAAELLRLERDHMAVQTSDRRNDWPIYTRRELE